jgi:hypothetical protein
MRFASSTLSRFLVGTVWIGAAVVLMAQDTTTTQITPGTSSVTSQVERAEVVYVSGNELVVKMESGEVRHLSVPDSAKATVDGKELTIRDLKPGMKLQRTITTTTSPRTVRTVRNITGKVVTVFAPNTVILNFPDGNKQYKIPKDQVFIIDGQKKTAFDLRPGMPISATVVTEVPEVLTSEQRVVTGTAPPPPPKPATPPPQPVLLIEQPAPAPPPTTVATARPAPPPPAPEPPPAQLPKTGSPVPLVGLIGLLSFGASLALRTLRNRA